jgi:lipopolysaccharide transport system ATP-binding protein
VELYGAGDRPTRVVASGENVRVRVLARFAERHPNPVVGVMIRTRIGMEVYGTNTMLEQIHCGGGEALEPGDLLEVNFEFPCSLTPQEYTLTVATQQPDGSSHDWLDDVLSFQVLDMRPTAGVANLRAHVTAKRIKSEELRVKS